ncbi:MAG: hypothetical protein ACLUTU_20625 [Blautia faecis]
MRGLVVMIMAYKYSFQDIVNAKVATTAIPGSAIGVMIYLKDFILVQPSISADPQAHNGMALK